MIRVLPIFLLVTVSNALGADYTRDVKPLLKRKCYACHSGLRQRGGLRLDTAKFVLRGGDSGAVVDARNSRSSELIRRITSRESGYRMPPASEGEPLSVAEVKRLKDWIDAGAKAPKFEKPSRNPQSHWSYHAPKRAPLPAQVGRWGRNEVDRFIARHHRRRGLRPSSPADKSTLLRRVYLDLIGVPPTLQELQRFLADNRPDAYEQLVRSLLADPRYGQRWGRHWMDVWRYSDWYGSGPEIRYGQRHIWRWRDWIVDSLNDDKGYDQMLTEMLAADELTPLDDKRLAATGFIGRNWYKLDRNVWMRELVEHSARGFLAVTLKCARCHDHKFDPIPQEDYYRFRAFFEPHGVRTDPLTLNPPTLVDRGKKVLADGVARVYDAEPKARTYVFTRGDDRYPDKNREVTAGVPVSLGKLARDPVSVSLPAAASQPQLKQSLVRERLAAAKQQVADARAALANSKHRLAKAKTADPDSVQPVFEEFKSPVFADQFQKIDPQKWKVRSGDWRIENGRLVQSTIATFRTIRCLKKMPRDFLLRLRYRVLKPGGVHSVGFNYDAGGTSHHSIYTWINPRLKKSGVQAFHRANGRDFYPRAGIFPAKLKFETPIVLDLAVRGRHLNLWLDGKLHIVYDLPQSRLGHLLELWNHEASAEYTQLEIYALPKQVKLSSAISDSIPSPLNQPLRLTKADLVQQLSQDIARGQYKLLRVSAKYEAVKAQIRAERARVAKAKQATILARAAAAAEKRIAVIDAEWSVQVAQRQWSQSTTKARAANLRKAQAALAKAKQAVASAGAKYTGFPKGFPRESSGRRTALARWLTRSENPRTSRVAVNHIWLRLFGQALVESVDDFGMRGKSPSHPELLDWLALYLVDQQWRMKPLHYLLVTSATYRQASATRAAGRNGKTDPNNRFLWRMNHRRMHAEVVRDSVLQVSGLLDQKFGGPEIVATTGMTNYRRSMYFWVAPNRQMQFLKLFDAANPDECYRRKPSVVPQQALALSNSRLVTSAGRLLARELDAQHKSTDSFVTRAFLQVLSRPPSQHERVVCKGFLARHAQLLKRKKLARFAGVTTGVPPSNDPSVRARENLILVLLNHNDFITIR